MEEFYFGNFSLYRIFRKIDQYLLLNVYYKSISKIINRNNKLFFLLYFFTIGFTKNTKKVLYRDKMDKL